MKTSFKIFIVATVLNISTAQAFDKPTFDASDANRNLAETGIVIPTNPDFYRPRTIRGICNIGGDGQMFGVPCRNLTIILNDAAGKEITRAQTADSGEFAFYVQKEKNYSISTDSSKYQFINAFKRPLIMGDVVDLKIKRVSK